MITAVPARADDTLAFDTSALRLRFADGHTIKGLDADSILAQSRNDPEHVMQKLSTGYRADLVGQNAWGAMCLIPPGTDLKDLQSITFRVNSAPLTIRGEFLWPDQVQARYGNLLKGPH